MAPTPSTRPAVQQYRTQTTLPVVSTVSPHLDDIDLPEDAWEDEDHSEWYQTATQDFLKPPRQRVSALPPQPLQANLEIQKNVIPSEVGMPGSSVQSPEEFVRTPQSVEEMEKLVEAPMAGTPAQAVESDVHSQFESVQAQSDSLSGQSSIADLEDCRISVQCGSQKHSHLKRTITRS